MGTLPIPYENIVDLLYMQIDIDAGIDEAMKRGESATESPNFLFWLASALHVDDDADKLRSLYDLWVDMLSEAHQAGEQPSRRQMVEFLEAAIRVSEDTPHH